MKVISNILNIAIAVVGVELVMRLMYTYNDPITFGSLWIIMVCAKCCLDVFKKEK